MKCLPEILKNEISIRQAVSKLILVCCVFILALVVGSEKATAQFRLFKNLAPKRAEPLPVTFTQVPTTNELIQTFNSRSQLIRQLNSSVTIDMKGAPKVKGELQVEFPTRMRLKAGVMGVSELGIDVGSNEQSFWIWSKVSLPGQPPAFYYANQQAYKQSRIHDSIPLDPKWLLDAIGVIQFSPDSRHVGPEVGADGRWKFYSVTQTSTGPQTRVILISPGTGLIEQQAIYNSANKLLAYTNSIEHKPYRLGNGQSVALPKRIELHMIQPNGADEMMLVEVSDWSIDSLFGDPRQMWSMPNPDNVQKIDLTRLGAPLEQPNQPRAYPAGYGG